ncbi:hypothetical protein [Kitasatospora sp. KL5]|uniref:hypothetical protein n=1 Tax=Kitasatospora sp. KL5 TaxID=3425125 RepID=UPI003D6E6D53
MLKKSVAVAAAAAAAGVLALSGTAEAAATASNTRTQYLAANPGSYMATSCTTRDIYLASGTYTWSWVPTETNARDIYLGAATYTWKDCLVPKDGYYVQTSTLQAQGTNWAPATVSHNLAIYTTGTWTWGSLLDPHF